MPHNEIFIHTDRGEYVGGDVIYGNVFLAISHSTPSKSLTLEIKGYEKVEWIEERTEWYDDNGERKSRVVRNEYKADRDFFKHSFPLISYPGGFPAGNFSYPFQFRLPDSLPGVFLKKGKHYKAKIQYKVKAVLDIPHGKDLKCKQHLFVNEKLDKTIQPKHHSKTMTVRTCCCFPRGPVTCEAWVDKNAYMAGETAQVHVSVNNDSAVEVTHFTSKFVREIKLRDNHGHVKHIRDIVNQQKYPGTHPHSNKSSDIPVRLLGKKGHPSQPSTHSKLVSCEYYVMIEMDIPWAPDLEIYSPITIYAPQNTMWASWQAPSWIASAQQQQVNSQVAVPAEVLAQMQNGYFHASAPSATLDLYSNTNSSSSATVAHNNVTLTFNEKSPLLH